MTKGKQNDPERIRPGAGRGKATLAGLCVVLVVWSYFARPVYDYLRIAVARVWDMALEKYSTPYARQDHQTAVDAASEQAGELTRYFEARRRHAADAPEIRHLDFSSEDAYDHSTGELRAHLRASLGYDPAAVPPPTEPVRETPIGEDTLATYTRLSIPIAPGIHSVGVYIRPKNRAGRLPLVIAAHGRGGPPLRGPDGKIGILSHISRDLGRGAVERGYAVWEPTFVFYATHEPDDLRERLAVRAEEAGTTLPAMEILKVVRSLDALVRRPEIDPARVAMVGISYGGFYTLYTTALEPRIKAAVVAAYFNDRTQVLDSSEPYGFLDWRLRDSLTLLRDPYIVALVCPRSLEVQAGTHDNLFPVEGARRTESQAAEFYHQLHVDDRFQFVEFMGRHDFNAREAWDFLARSF